MSWQRFRKLLNQNQYLYKLGLLFENKVKTNKDAFLAKVRKVSADLEIQPDWLMAVMNSESNLNPQAVNKYTKATGLIQFMPATAKGLGTSVEALYEMSNVNQLDFVYAYYKPLAHKILSYIDLYMATFFPAAMGKPDNYVLQTDTIAASKIAQQNPIFDTDKNDKITVGEIKKAFLSRIPAEYIQSFVETLDTVKKFARRNWLGIAVSSTFIVIGIVVMIKNSDVLIGSKLKAA